MQSPPPLAPPAPSGSSRRWLWLVVTYLGSGLPYGLVRETIGVHMGRIGVPRAETGWLTLSFLPWAFKFAWAPFLDRFGSRRAWIAPSLLACAAIVGLYAWDLGGVPLAARESGTVFSVPWEGWALVVALAFASATQDVGIDARAVETFPGRDAHLAGGVRITVYRVALVVAGGVLVGLAGAVGWQAALLVGAAMLAALGIACVFLPPVPKVPVGTMGFWGPLARLFRRPGFLPVAVFVFLYKLGDAMLGPMGPQFLLRDPVTEGGLGWDDALMGASRTAGIAAAVAGGLLGAWATKSWGVLRALVVLGGVQAVSNLGYAGAALVRTDAAGWGAVLLENLSAGLGTAPFAALLMLSCDRGLAGAQYALLASLFAAAGSIAGPVSGHGADAFGWAGWFGITFLVAVPAFLFLPAVARWLRTCPGADRPPVPTE